MRTFFIFFFALLLAVHLYLLHQHYQAFVKFQHLDRWKTTQAKILISQLKKHSTYNPDWRVWRTSYSWHLKYLYWVERSRYIGKKLHLAQRASYTDPLTPKALIKRYPAGRELTIYYNPNNPSEAIIEKNYDKDNVILIFISMLVVGATLFYFIRYYR
jgi:hypothetical protein